jgi:hypothetical protein
MFNISQKKETPIEVISFERYIDVLEFPLDTRIFMVPSSNSLPKNLDTNIVSITNILIEANDDIYKNNTSYVKPIRLSFELIAIPPIIESTSNTITIIEQT